MVEPVDISLLSYLLPTYYILTTAEASSNLSRFDGVRYGYRSHTVPNSDLLTLYKKSRTEGFGSEVRRRILLGTFALSDSYYDAYYKKAQTVRTKIINEFAKTFESVDYLLGPTAPSTAFKIGENTADPLQMYLTDILTVAANLAGVPSISIPLQLL